MPSVYLESSIPSYLASRPNRDLVIAARQQVLYDWWHDDRHKYDLYVSEAVVAEISLGDPECAARRREFIADLDVLVATEEITELTRMYESRLGLTGRARADLPHFAFAVAYRMDFLLTLNLKHIANGIVKLRLRDINSELGLWHPVICTPDELLGRDTGEIE